MIKKGKGRKIKLRKILHLIYEETVQKRQHFCQKISGKYACGLERVLERTLVLEDSEMDYVPNVFICGLKKML